MARGLMPGGPPGGPPPSAPQGAPQGAMPPEAGGMPPSGPETGAQGRRATDEEKGVYRQFAGNVTKMLYQEKTADAIAETLRAGTDVSPVEGLAQIISSAVARVAYSGLENGLKIDREMALAATMQVVEDIGTNVAGAAAAQPLSEEQMEAVYLRSMELLAERRDDQQRTGAAAGASLRRRPPDKGLPAGPGPGSTRPPPGAAGPPPSGPMPQ